MRIVTILETHRNDYVIGSVELAARSGAEVFHADGHLDYRYGDAVEDGMRWKVGRARDRGDLHPGHTLGSMSYLLQDAGGEPWIVFTGDALFAGDLGGSTSWGDGPGRRDGRPPVRIDLQPALPLGDEVDRLSGPRGRVGHAASIADRKWTTLGIERKRNPKLQVDGAEEFVEKMAVELEMPPYFREMERLNLVGAPSRHPPRPCHHLAGGVRRIGGGGAGPRHPDGARLRGGPRPGSPQHLACGGSELCRLVCPTTRIS